MIKTVPFLSSDYGSVLSNLYVPRLIQSRGQPATANKHNCKINECTDRTHITPFFQIDLDHRQKLKTKLLTAKTRKSSNKNQSIWPTLALKGVSGSSLFLSIIRIRRIKHVLNTTIIKTKKNCLILKLPMDLKRKINKSSINQHIRSILSTKNKC